MNIRHVWAAVLLFFASDAITAQVSPKDINGARNSAADGTSFDTNVSFTLKMTLAGDDTLRDTATVGDDVSIITTIRPESEHIGSPADIIIVDYRPPIPYMRNTDGDFVAWNGKLPELVPSEEGVTLADELDVEVFSGKLGTVGDHRIFVGFLVDGILYFTPSALRLDITEDTPEPTPLEQAVTLFESTISPTIVQSVCIACHVAGGQADGQAQHIFVRTSNPDHLSINFDEFDQLHAVRGTSYILDKTLGRLAHGGLQVLFQGGTQYNNLQEFLELLDQAGP